MKLLHLASVLNCVTWASSDPFSHYYISMMHDLYVWMLPLHSLSLSRSLISSHVFSELMASMANMCVNYLDFALASLAWLSLVRAAAVSISINHSSNFVESLFIEDGNVLQQGIVRSVCFCVVHRVSVYWHTTLQMVLQVLGLKSVVPWTWERDSIVTALGSLCSPNPLLADLLWLLLIAISCCFLLWVCLSLPGC